MRSELTQANSIHRLCTEIKKRQENAKQGKPSFALIQNRQKLVPAYPKAAPPILADDFQRHSTPWPQSKNENNLTTVHQCTQSAPVSCVNKNIQSMQHGPVALIPLPRSASQQKWNGILNSPPTLTTLSRVSLDARSRDPFQQGEQTRSLASVSKIPNANPFAAFNPPASPLREGFKTPSGGRSRSNTVVRTVKSTSAEQTNIGWVSSPPEYLGSSSLEGNLPEPYSSSSAAFPKNVPWSL